MPEAFFVNSLVIKQVRMQQYDSVVVECSIKRQERLIPTEKTCVWSVRLATVTARARRGTVCSCHWNRARCGAL